MNDGTAGKTRGAPQITAEAAGGRHLDAALTIIGEGVWDWDMRTDWVRHNAQWCRLLGLDEGYLEHPLQDFVVRLHPDDRDAVMRAIHSGAQGQGAYQSEHRMVHRDGTVIWVLDRGQVVERDAAGNAVRMVGSLTDITERKRSEKVTARRTLLLRTIASVSALLTGELDEPQFMARICQALVEEDQFRMAWIGLVDGVRVRPAAEAGFDAGYLAGADIRCDDSPQGQGPTGTAIRLGRTIINDDTETDAHFAPWRERARAQGYRSSAATPLRVKGSVVGAISVYSGEPHAFGPDEVVLLEQLAADLGAAMARRAAEAALRESEARFRAMAEHSADWIWSLDLQGRHIYSNQKTVDMLGYAMEEFLALDPATLVHPDDLPLFRETFRKAVSERTGWNSVVLRWRRQDGSYRALESSASPLFDETGRLLGFQGVDRDITERRQAEERIEFLAHHDVLTGLPNRILLRDRFEQAVAFADRDETHVAMLFLDLDNFKVVNDSLGHAAGDRLLQAVVERLHRCMRESDTVSRQGGDEFILLLNEIPDLAAVERIAGEILAHMAEPLEIEGHVLHASCSVGISLYPGDGQDFDTLLQKADTAMYKAKEAGRNTYRFFDEAMNRQAHEHLLLQSRLRQALSRGEFSLHYQPQLDIASGRVFGVEALLRWRNPELGDIPPGRFIPVAEDSGLIVSIGAWVLEESCRQAQAWRSAGFPELGISVNLSALQFRRTNLVETVAAALEQSGLPPHLLELELTESILLQDVENTLHTVRHLKALGVRLSIDDFGTGYSSLSYLKRFAVDKLKIDRSFIRDIGTDPDDAAIVRAIIRLARSLRLETIAEGVETEEQLAFIRQEGCQQVQGYLVSRPLGAAALEAFLRSSSPGSRA